MAISGSTRSASYKPSSSGGTQVAAMSIVTTLFFIWGFITSLNDILIPHLKGIFSLNYAEVMLVQVAFFLTYAVFGLPAGKLVEWIGYQRTMVVGLIAMALGAVLFVPAASAPSFPLFLAALAVLGAGITTLQVAANPYVTFLGPPQTASSRLNLTQAFNSAGTVLAPMFGAWLILGEAPKVIKNLNLLPPAARHAYQVAQAATVKLPYISITAVLVLLGLLIAFYKFPRLDITRDFRPVRPGQADSIWNYRHLVLGAVGIFLYVGAEVSIGSFLTSYLHQPEIGGFSLEKAAFIGLIGYWGGLMVGRFIGSGLLQRVKSGPVIGICAIVAGCLVIATMLSFGLFAVCTVILVGLFNSIMFPSIFTLAIAELGPLTGKASGLLCVAIVGGAVIPYLQGRLADQIGIHHAFLLPVLCYVFIAYYGFRGSKIVLPA
jgi:MFS transporter, FHS family, L-fucose permease